VHLIPPFTAWGNFSPKLLGVHLVRSRGSRAAAGVYLVLFALLNEGQIAVSFMTAGMGSGKWEPRLKVIQLYAEQLIQQGPEGSQRCHCAICTTAGVLILLISDKKG
jgi:hypothetical protein